MMMMLLFVVNIPQLPCDKGFLLTKLRKWEMMQSVLEVGNAHLRPAHLRVSFIHPITVILFIIHFNDDLHACAHSKSHKYHCRIQKSQIIPRATDITVVFKSRNDLLQLLI